MPGEPLDDVVCSAIIALRVGSCVAGTSVPIGTGARFPTRGIAVRKPLRLERCDEREITDCIVGSFC